MRNISTKEDDEAMKFEIPLELELSVCNIMLVLEEVFWT
jgi:hypothetical protein